MAGGELELSSGFPGVCDSQFRGGTVEGFLTCLVVVQVDVPQREEGLSLASQIGTWWPVLSLPVFEALNRLPAALNLS